MEGELLLDALLESLTLLQGQGVRLRNDWHNVDNLGELLQDDNVDGLKRVAGRLDEEEAAVDAGILDVPLTLGSELLAQIGRVLILDVLDDGVPAAVVVDQVAVAGGIDDVEPQADAILLDDVGNGVNLGGGPDDLLGMETALGLDEARGENGVDQCRLAQTCLAYDGRDLGSAELSRDWAEGGQSEDEENLKRTNADDVELETTLQELTLDLRGDAVKTDMALGVDGGSWHGRHCE
jgi:hypothetical protein